MLKRYGVKSVNRIETLDQLQEHFFLVFTEMKEFKQIANSLIRKQPRHFIRIAWHYHFGTPDYKRVIRQEHDRRTIDEIHWIGSHISIFIETIKHLSNSDNFKDLANRYSAEIKPTMIMIDKLKNI